MSDMVDEGFDVIGDVHGMGKELVALLRHLGYDDSAGYFAHPTRCVVFVGDLIDRGPEQLLVLETARAMVDAGTASVVLGNHEFNAIAFHTPHRTIPFGFLRERSPKNLDQHKDFIAQVGLGSTLHGEVIEWFRTLPLWLDLDGLRVVHACWDEASKAKLADGSTLTDDVLHAAVVKGTPEYHAIEVLLKGPEIPIDPPYHDKDGHHREHARYAWWRPDAKTMFDAIEVPSGLTAHVDGEGPGTNGPAWELAAPDAPITERPVDPYPADAPPVLFGHYWRTGTPHEPESPNVACTDFSACKGGDLVAYRWSGESTLSKANFDWVGHTP